jgi:hypothetical protein
MSNKKKVVYRSSVSGRLVKESYAKAHPKTTERQHVPLGKRGKGK